MKHEERFAYCDVCHFREAGLRLVDWRHVAGRWIDRQWACPRCRRDCKGAWRYHREGR